MALQIPIVQLDGDLPLPTYAHEGDAGLDLYAREPATLAAGGGRAPVVVLHDHGNGVDLNPKENN